MTMKSRNFSYAFNEEYVEGVLDSPRNTSALNDEIWEYSFDANDPNPAVALAHQAIGELRECSFELYSTYPGILMGTGYLHDFLPEGPEKDSEVIKTGFSLDYVTGQPYLPGSSLKGTLRSYFPGKHREEGSKIEAEYTQYIGELTGLESQNVDDLESDIFNRGDVFLGAYPVLGAQGDRSLFSPDFITPHKGGPFKNPIPISIMRVRPNVCFRFSFLLRDSVVNGVNFSAAQKLELFKQILLDMGVGAKTNVGYGKLSETKVEIPTKKSNADVVHATTSIGSAFTNKKTVNVTIEKTKWDASNPYVLAKRGSLQFKVPVPPEKFFDLQPGKKGSLLKIEYTPGAGKDGIIDATLKEILRK